MQHNYQLFTETLWSFYVEHKRILPWRLPEQNGLFSVYKILVSEIMLQQTQAHRVIPKYEVFIKRFPNIEELASATLAEVLGYWQGLGYNRRAKYLWQAAQNLQAKNTPWNIEDLEQCLGIGHNTAAATLVYAYNQPIVFIETNIRTVFIHHFFIDQTEQIRDSELQPIIQEALDIEHPREWYWALMDYGSYLKKTTGNTSRQSAHYTKQSAFEGSKRQLRGKVVRYLSASDIDYKDLHAISDDLRLAEVVTDLQNEGLLVITSGVVHLPR